MLKAFTASYQRYSYANASLLSAVNKIIYPRKKLVVVIPNWFIAPHFRVYKSSLNLNLFINLGNFLCEIDSWRDIASLNKSFIL